MGEKVELLDFLPSMFGMRVRVALAEKGIAYEYKETDIFNKSKLLLDMNPIHKKIPVLIHNGSPICESIVILEYIEEVWKNNTPSLLPSDPYLRSQARFWLNYIDQKACKTKPNIQIPYFFNLCMKTQVYLPGRDVMMMIKEEEHEKARKEFLDVYKVLETELGEKKFFGGEEFGIVDVALIGFSSWFGVYEKYGKLSMAVEFPKLVGWVGRCMEKDSVAKSLPDRDKVVALADEFVKKFKPK